MFPIAIRALIRVKSAGVPSEALERLARALESLSPIDSVQRASATELRFRTRRARQTRTLGWTGPASEGVIIAKTRNSGELVLDCTLRTPMHSIGLLAVLVMALLSSLEPAGKFALVSFVSLMTFGLHVVASVSFRIFAAAAVEQEGDGR